MLEKFKAAAAGATLVEMFDCQGELAKPVKFLMTINRNPKYRAWAKMDDSQGQPDASRLEKARIFAREVMNKVSSYKA
jgi:hypothetical protein